MPKDNRYNGSGRSNLNNNCLRRPSQDPHPLVTAQQINIELEKLVDTLVVAPNKVTSRKVITGFSRPGYTPELRALKEQAQRARRRAQTTGLERDWELFRQACHKADRELLKLSTKGTLRKGCTVPRVSLSNHS
jgi:hypothetical protein